VTETAIIITTCIVFPGSVYVVDQPPPTVVTMAQENVTITCTVSGHSPVNVRWFFISGNSTSSVPLHLQQVTFGVDTITSQLALRQTTPADEGLYFCRATNNVTNYPTFSVESNFTRLVVYRKY